ncbi:Hypothetical predicted protein [Pelobates cultripes]|uniref:RNB domain-containing protein n=1 Tax=Pelobates cultripes TaxID=61616 RepID=A0AAD1SJY9_PELCU|nr:Hypothetical predicted protein [Pelobates cultripes]
MGQFSGPEIANLSQLQEKVELRLACEICSKRENEITFVLRLSKHSCKCQVLLARLRNGQNGGHWHEVRVRPTFPVPARYAVCWHYQPNKGCIKHSQNCTFAWSEEEIEVWAFEKTCKLDRNQLQGMLMPTPYTGAAPAKDLNGILEKFGGHFQEVCEQCFYQSPQKITNYRHCQTHPRGVPLLAHIVTGESRTICHAVHPLPRQQTIHLCHQSSRGILCRVEGGHCPHAHSEVELAVWKAEKDDGLSRGNIVQQLEQNEGFYCRLCLVTAPTQESFEMHCSTPEHRRMMEDDTLTVWNHRKPPTDINDFTLCESPLSCVFGTGCPKAHSKEELEEWMLRMKVSKRNKQVVEVEGLQSYQNRLIEEYRLDDETLSEYVEGARISCDRSLDLHIPEKPVTTTWTFTVHSKMSLVHVALLKRDPGVSFSLLAPDLPESCHYAQGCSFQAEAPRLQYTIKVLAEGSVFGLFEQWLVLDFGERPALLKKIFLKIGGHDIAPVSQNNASHQEINSLPTSERWYADTKLCVPCKERTQEEKSLMDLYKPPKILNQQHMSTNKNSLTTENYRRYIHEWLLQEEAAREQVISRLNMKVPVSLSKMVTTLQGMWFPHIGGLCAEVFLPKGMTKDTEEGYLLSRSVNTALLAPCPQQDDKVYEVLVVSSVDLESSILLEIPERCCRELAIEERTSPLMEIQFQMDRWNFCLYHKAVDLLQDEKLVLPELANCSLPTFKGSLSWGNSKQQMAASYIIGSVPEGKLVAPLLIYGPFGTGKTYTMAKSALEVIKQDNTRVLICTHNNSVADLYIREHFHPHVMSGHSDATPLRVKYKLSNIRRTDPITLQYCALKEDGLSFISPHRKDLDQHRIIVVTAETSRDLEVPRGYFSHIFLDEAAQMLESEALIPLALANNWTRIIMAGDHMQESPRLFSQKHTDCHEQHDLLTRLFSFYQRHDCPAAKGARIVFHQNYRSVPEIISFISRCFYVGRGDSIDACANDTEALPAGQFTFGLCHVHGPCKREGSSWVNESESLQVLEVVRKVLEQWPKSWGPVRASNICVVSQGSQVQLIRQELRKINCRDITVTTYSNIIGCEYQVIILSTVRSVESLPSTSQVSSNFSLEVFCDPRILNTILTRARSQIIVVGDMVALCSFGGCSRIWRRYVRESVERGSTSPSTLSMEEIKQAVSNLQAWNQQPENLEEVEDSDSWISDLDINSEDQILQELLERKTETVVTVSEEGILEVSSGECTENKSEKYTNFSSHVLEQYFLTEPNKYKKCHFFKETFESGHALTVNECPQRLIKIKGRMNCGMAFSGDQVVVQLSGSSTHEGKVVGVMKAKEKGQRFVCFMDPHDKCIMIPIDKSVTKIFCHAFKEKPGYIPIRSLINGKGKTHGLVKLTQEMKQNSLFLVQVVKWDQGFYYPLGFVNRILPKIQTVEMGLEILDLNYRLERTGKYPKLASLEAKKLPSQIPLTEGRQDCRNLITFTIDPTNAKDLDDAISVQDLEDCYEIGVHIADVAAVVLPGSELDKEAKARGVTYYDHKREPEHMLPLKLSADLCSLKSQCDRRALTLFVQVEKNTDRMVKGYFCRTLIRSDRQLTYEEANDILRIQQGPPLVFNSVEDCVRVAYHFSQVHCRYRLQEAAIYKQPDEGRRPGDRSAHRMIEELMIMYNNWVAEYLCEQQSISDLVPVRCQDQPSFEKLENLRDKLKQLIPLSTYLSHHLLDIPVQEHPPSELKVLMLTSVWKELQDAAQKEDYVKVIDLLSTDDLHPQLCSAARDFRRSLGGARFRRSTMPGFTGHYSLQLCSYTWASSPIRRYIDIVLQRLLHSTLTKVKPQMSPEDIEMLCHEFDRQVQQESAYEKKTYALELALSFCTQVQQKTAVVVSAEPNQKGLKLVFPMNGDSLSSPVEVDYSMLQPVIQPEDVNGGTRLSWRRRVYSYEYFRVLPYKHISQRGIIEFSNTAWCDAVSLMRKGYPEQLLPILRNGIEMPNSKDIVQQSSCGHYIELSIDLHPGDPFLVQLCSTLDRGLPTPSPQLFSPASTIQFCLEHTHKPVDCFAKQAQSAPRQHYKNAAEYQQVWYPLCEMEAVVSAVSEGGGVLLRDVPVKWKNTNTIKESVGMKGAFKVSKDLIKECDLDMDFNHCYLCLRMEELRATDSPGLLDSHTYTWVVHGLTKEQNNATKEDGGKVEFHIHQATMQHVPQEALERSALFTVEIIPKLLPDIRKKTAIRLLNSASELAKNIALGQRVPDKNINVKFKSQISFDISENPRKLNTSQTKAVKAALTQPFTLIQGPPGTGKTIVGVHLVYWFHHINEELNSQVQAEAEADEEEEKNEEEGQKHEKKSSRRVLMYCGPSNKSVDVVAEMLLPLRSKLRPLRVYSEQMELMEFPYPGSSLRMSGYPREGKPNPVLRPLTLHHLIRQRSNTYHGSILAMDIRIQRGDEISQEEIEAYKETLYKARSEELARHDVILCTCVAASGASLTRLRVAQLVVDECAMCTEPEVLVPLVNHKHVDSVVLLGDHRQLRPVILNDVCRQLNMERSMFERYQNRALMLDTQYRMHSAICEFPSQEFYDNLLRTSDQIRLRPSLFCHTEQRICPVVFGEVDGKEQSLNVTTEAGNINSKANEVEADQAVRLARRLTQASVKQEDIAILTPYNAQVTLISKKLKEHRLNDVTVCTIMKSQGSEWRYVIFSTVRSMPVNELDVRPTIAWKRQHLGFLGDPNQINVALTRSKEGLCVLGNSYLLRCCPMWRRLIEHYTARRAVVHSSIIDVSNPRRR